MANEFFTALPRHYPKARSAPSWPRSPAPPFTSSRSHPPIATDLPPALLQACSRLAALRQRPPSVPRDSWALHCLAPTIPGGPRRSAHFSASASFAFLEDRPLFGSARLSAARRAICPSDSRARPSFALSPSFSTRTSCRSSRTMIPHRATPQVPALAFSRTIAARARSFTVSRTKSGNSSRFHPATDTS